MNLHDMKISTRLMMGLGLLALLLALMGVTAPGHHRLHQ